MMIINEHARSDQIKRGRLRGKKKLDLTSRTIERLLIFTWPIPSERKISTSEGPTFSLARHTWDVGFGARKVAAHPAYLRPHDLEKFGRVHRCTMIVALSLASPVPSSYFRDLRLDHLTFSSGVSRESDAFARARSRVTRSAAAVRRARRVSLNPRADLRARRELSGARARVLPRDRLHEWETRRVASSRNRRQTPIIIFLRNQSLSLSISPRRHWKKCRISTESRRPLRRSNISRVDDTLIARGWLINTVVNGSV